MPAGASEGVEAEGRGVPGPGEVEGAEPGSGIPGVGLIGSALGVGVAGLAAGMVATGLPVRVGVVGSAGERPDETLTEAVG